MKFFLNIFLILILTSLLTGCFTRSRPVYDLPYSYDEKAPPIWKLGWQHGCKSGLSAYGTNWHKQQYTFTQDVTKINNEIYYKAWNDSFNVCRAYANRVNGGDSKTREDRPVLFSPDDMDITNSGRRDDLVILKTGLFEGQSNKGFFGDAFEVNTPGYGSTAWGANVEECDWLNRCGDDIPKDPMDALLGF
jgi:hypothetical protein